MAVKLTSTHILTLWLFSTIYCHHFYFGNCHLWFQCFSFSYVAESQCQSGIHVADGSVSTMESSRLDFSVPFDFLWFDCKTSNKQTTECRIRMWPHRHWGCGPWVKVCVLLPLNSSLLSVGDHCLPLTFLLLSFCPLVVAERALSTGGSSGARSALIELWRCLSVLTLKM